MFSPRLLTAAAFALCVPAAALEPAPPSFSGIVNTTTIQDGLWSAGSTWDLGVPTDTDIAWIDHDILLLANGQEALDLRIGNAAPGRLEVYDGATALPKSAVIGDQQFGELVLDEVAQMELTAGLIAGLAAPARVEIAVDSRLRSPVLYAGTNGTAASVELLRGGELIVEEVLFLGADATLTVGPKFTGPAGFTPVRTHDLDIAAGATLAFDPTFLNGQAGDSWVILEYTGHDHRGFHEPLGACRLRVHRRHLRAR